MKKIISLLLIMTAALSLFSCEKNREYNEGEVAVAARELIPKTADLNIIYWGAGIGYVKNDSTSVGYYYEADPFSLIKYGITTVDDLKEMTRAVFSDSYSSNIFDTKLTSVQDGDEIISYARYYQNYSDAENREPDRIMVYSRAVVLLSDDVTYLPETIKVLYSKKQTVFVSIEASVKRGDKTQTRTITVGLVEEEDGWRIDTPTYISYDEGLN